MKNDSNLEWYLSTERRLKGVGLHIMSKEGIVQLIVLGMVLGIFIGVVLSKLVIMTH